MSIGSRIKARREKCGLSVIDLAERLGKARSTVYRYESDEVQDMPITVLEPLAEALKTTPAYLMGWTNDPNDYESDDLSDVRAELIEHFGGDARKIRAYLRAEEEDSRREAMETQSIGKDDDDELWTLREEMRRDPERRRLFKLAAHASLDDVKAADALLNALKATNKDFYDGDDPA